MTSAEEACRWIVENPNAYPGNMVAKAMQGLSADFTPWTYGALEAIPGPRRYPTTVEEAQWMELIGFAYLKEHAPHLLTDEGLLRPMPVIPDRGEERLPPAFYVILDLTVMGANLFRAGKEVHAKAMFDLAIALEDAFPHAAAEVERRYPKKTEQGQ